jgi:SnoaL-like domain
MKTWKDAWNWAAAECDAWNRRDLDAIMRRYAEDVALSSPAVVTRMGRADGWLHGKDEVRKYFEIGLQNPGLHFGLVDVLFGVNAINMIFRRETGVTVSDLFELDNEDRVIRLVACYGQA